MSLKPGELRKDFPALQQKVNGSRLFYLDNAATTQKPEIVIEKLERFYREDNANIGRSIHELGERATAEFEKSRKRVADFIGAEREEVVFTGNTTDSINLAASSLDFEGDIVVSGMAHHSNYLPWKRKARREGKEIRELSFDEQGLELEETKELIDEDVGLVAVSQISNTLGCVNPVEELAEIAHDQGAYILVDGAQSVPRMPVDVEELDVDFLAFSGHKMLAPSGTGVLYGRKELLNQMEPYRLGGGMVRKATEDEWEQPPEKFEAGTPNVAEVSTMKHAINYIEDVGRGNIFGHEKRISGLIRKRLEELEGVETYCSDESVLVSFTMEAAHPHDISEILDRNGVAIRAGHHCTQPLHETLDLTATARASPYLYNTEKDVEKLIEAVKQVKEVF